MRPLKLEVSGLTCFREPVSIDFGTLELMAIEGATGAGKSSLLDAMILALYGMVPRIGSQGLGELISHGRSGLAVTFDFELRGTRWRVARTINRKRPSQAMLSELVEEDGESVEKRRFNGVQEVQREVKSLLGIEGAAFQQAVILPQGKFQEFLRAQPAERRKILSELLGLKVYTAMRSKAGERVARLMGEVEALARQLSGEGALATADVVAGLELQVAQANAERDALASEVEARIDAVAELERVWTLCQKLTIIDQALVELEAREPETAALSARTERARTIAPLLPAVERAREAESRSATLVAERESQEARVRDLGSELAAREDAARTAELAAEQVGALRARIARLDEARGRFEQRAALRVELERAEQAVGRATAELEAIEQQRVEAADVHQRLEAEVARLVAEAGPPVSADEVLRWEALREVASRLGPARASWERERLNLVEARRALEAGEDALAEAEQERKRKDHAELVAADAVEAARTALAEAEQSARVALVREHLHAGDPCPVCEQVVERVPEVAIGVEVEAAREALAGAQKALERARGEAERARERAVTQRAKVSEHESRVTATEAREREAAEAVARDEATLVEVVEVGDGAVEDRFAAGLSSRLAALQEHRAHEHTLALERENLKRAVEEAARLEAAQAAARARRDEATVSQRDIAERLAAVEAALSELKDLDPQRERALAERLIDQLETARAEAVAAVAAAREALSIAEVELAGTGERLTEVQQTRTQALTKLAEAGVGIDDVEREAMSLSELAAAERAIAAHRAARAARIAEREATVRALDHQRTTAAELDAARSELSRSRARARAATERAAVQNEKLARAKEQLARAKDVGLEHEAKRREYQVYKRLNDDLSPRNFQEFLLEEVVSDLVRGASERLHGLSSGRYRMAADTSAGFLIVDLDHAGERRSTDTLSGGETFLASLAMALELSEQIRAKAGRVDLDCIFIDEGFGTLDAETLETVTEAVEGLKRPGRLVGIITHVGELAQRMPERLLVEKSATGSTVRFVDSVVYRRRTSEEVGG